MGTWSVASAVSDSAILWIVARQAPLSMGFSRQKHWSELPCPSPGDLPDPKIEPTSLNLLHCRRILYPLSHLEALSLYLPTIDVRSPRIRDVQNILHPVTLQVSEDTCYIPLETLWFLKLLYKDRRKDLFLKYNVLKLVS